MIKSKHALRSYFFPAILISSIIAGGIIGTYAPAIAKSLQPFGDLFINLIFTAIVPLIFFSVSAAITRTKSLAKLGRIFGLMALVFIVTSLCAAIYALLVVTVFPINPVMPAPLLNAVNATPANLTHHLVSMFTVNDFSQLLSHNNMLALIIFSLLVGFASSGAKEKGLPFVEFLQAGETVFMRLFNIIMYYAPIGFFAYFAAMVSDLGPKIITTYAQITLLYYVFGVIYFIAAFSIFAKLADRKHGLSIFWRSVWLPASTSIATCSSAASIPANLAAANEMGIRPEIYETVIPLGMLIHKDGSVIGGIFKIAFLFSVFHLSFASAATIATALGIAMLVGTVMGAIPGGGMLGELLILSVYGFPASMLIAVAAISVIIDPLATLLNVTGNTVCALWIDRLERRCLSS